ncbi:MAG: AraC family transcriptional regulator [Acidobacteriaceae bacterium]|nr:AraC family transcriptional regulator [Acidobacteriaceae bacterium]
MNSLVDIRLETRIIASYYHTPSEIAQEIFLTVLRAGHLHAGPQYRVERRICAGHDLLFCLKGGGFVMTGGHAYSVGPGQMGWLNGHYPHAHWANPAGPWELLWARIDGHILERLWGDLDVKRLPVFDFAEPQRIAAGFRRIFRTINNNPPAMEAHMNADIANIIACVCETRQIHRMAPTPGAPRGLQTIIDDLNLYFYRQWRVEDLAEIAGMSVPNLFRYFRQITGATPISFLRRIRINQAKRRLVEGTDSIKEVAEQVGYADPFYFSRDFKRHTGMSPSDFRQHEIGESAEESITD